MTVQAKPTLQPTTVYDGCGIGRILIIASILSLVGLGASAWVLSNGAADPPRAPALIWDDMTLTWAGGTASQTITRSTAVTSAQALPAKLFSLEAQALLTSASDPLAAWGVWLEDAAGNRLMVAINGAQYVTARVCPKNLPDDLDSCAPLQEPNQHIRTVWKTFHLIHPRGQSNRIRLEYLPEDWTGGLRLRLNSEWMWDLPFHPPSGRVTWGLWGQPGPEAGASIRWTRVQIWADRIIG